MTTEIYNKIKMAASQTEDDSILGATVRRILEESRALEAMQEYDSNQIDMFENTESLAESHVRERFQTRTGEDEWLVSQYNRNRDINEQINNVDEIKKK